jgi:hypothetical protein
MPRIATRRPDNHHHPASETSCRDDTVLAIIKAVVDSAERFARKYQLGVFKVQAAFPQRGFSLCGIEGDPHRYNVATKKVICKIFVATEKAVLQEAAA